jgi:DNA-binding GntR family transcriptional regulator
MAAQDNGDRASAALGSIQLKRSSTAEQLAELLREMILRGEIKPGERLREASLAASIGVSRNTMRESIRVLAREGIVTSEMHHGAVITKLTAEDVADIFRVRRVLELSGLDATAHAEPEQLAGLADAVDRLTDAASDGDWSGVVDADQLFHERLVSLLGSRRLDRFFSAIQAEVRLCISIVDRSASDTEALTAEHTELLELILGRKTQRCKELLTGHLRDAEKLIVATIDEP